MSIKEKIEQRLNNLQIILESNKHLEAPEETENLIDSISKFWSALNEEDKEYIQAARHAIEKRMEWK
jgi:hypothetical protein